AGAGEKHLQSVVAVEGRAEGRVRVLAASTEIGQGTNTVFAQIAADALGVPYDAVDVAQPDTAHVPNSGPTVASRTVTIVGKLVEAAARDVKAALAASRGARGGGGHRRPAPPPRAAARRRRVPAAAVRLVGRDDVPRRRLRRVLLGSLRRAGDRGHGDVRGARRGLRRRAGGRARHAPGP